MNGRAIRGRAILLATSPAVSVSVAVSVLASILLGAAAPAQAQSTPTPAPTSASTSAATQSGQSFSQSQRASFGIQAATPVRPDSRSILSYNVTPGVTINDYVAVSNIGQTALNLAVYGTDATNAPDGKVVFAPATQKSTQAGAWVSIGGAAADSRVAVPPRTTAAGPGVVIVPIHIAIPADATPGDHVGAVVASLETAGRDASGGQVQLDQRIAERIYIRVSGPLTPRLAVQELRVTYHQALTSLNSGSAVVTYTVKNTGNAILSATQQVRLSGWFGSSAQAASVPIVPPLLPGNSVQERVVLTGVAPRIRLHATVSLTATAVVASQADPGLVPFRATASTWALPWTLLAIVLAGLALGGVGVWWRRRSGSAGGDSGTDGSGGPTGPTGPVTPDAAVTDPGSADPSGADPSGADPSGADPVGAVKKPAISGVSAWAALVGALLVGGVFAPADSAYADTVPYSDARVTGAIGLCDAANHALHGGSTTSAPFVSRAVGATAAPPGYAGDGRTATLYAYQPRPGVPAGEWSGQLLTASSSYSNPAHPMAQSTGADDALLSFLTGYPPQVDGLVQLRLYLGAPETPLYQKHYDATDIRISGGTWSVVRGGDQNCASGTATSFESSVLPSAELTAPAPVSTPRPAAASSADPAAVSAAATATATGPAPSAGPTSGATAAASEGAAVGLAAHASDQTAPRGWWGAAALLALIVATAGLFLVQRRRRRPAELDPDAPEFSGESTKRGSKE